MYAKINGNEKAGSMEVLKQTAIDNPKQFVKQISTHQLISKHVKNYANNQNEKAPVV